MFSCMFISSVGAEQMLVRLLLFCFPLTLQSSPSIFRALESQEENMSPLGGMKYVPQRLKNCCLKNVKNMQQIMTILIHVSFFFKITTS